MDGHLLVVPWVLPEGAPALAGEAGTVRWLFTGSQR